VADVTFTLAEVRSEQGRVEDAIELADDAAAQFLQLGFDDDANAARTFGERVRAASATV